MCTAGYGLHPDELRLNVFYQCLQRAESDPPIYSCTCTIRVGKGQTMYTNLKPEHEDVNWPQNDGLRHVPVATGDSLRFLCVRLTPCHITSA